MIHELPYRNRHILVCPLDWGLGHAARCVPLIKQLKEQGNRVVAGCTSWQKEFLQSEVRDLEYVELFGYNVAYSIHTPLALKILWQFPRLRYLCLKEHAWLGSFVSSNKIDVVISDNRYGLYTPHAECVLITHQLQIPAPWLKDSVNQINRRYIEKFDVCWVPDYPGEETSLGGKLSHTARQPANVKYIGPLSRFTKQPLSFPEFDVLVLLSGAEPQRSVLEEKLCAALRESGLKVCFVRGTAAAGAQPFASSFTVVDICNSSQLQDLLLRSRNIICRSGYSTLMDLHALGLKAILVPTPGQGEQEYLAELWRDRFGCAAIEQKNVSAPLIISLLSGEKTHAPQK